MDLHVNNGSSLVIDYIDERQDELKAWDVVLLQNKKPNAIKDLDLLPDFNTKLRERHNGFLDDDNYFHTTGRRRLAQPEDSANGLS